MDAMRMPAPHDLAQAPLWEIYIIAQSVAAMRGQIPKHALAVGVEIHGVRIKLKFQLSTVTEEDQTDMDDILSELEAYVGQGVEVQSAHEIRKERRVLPDGTDNLYNLYLSRYDETQCE
ncbi:hypothetical protein RI444_18295 [Paenarthrobacter sp. AT5]|uniref:hypothetical protein n=1 Tax=Paenarthrobacter TaxID=1742992 RepID=UPI001A98654C|nr:MULTISPECIES: hypothetical protein [Paenarthrobacter]WOC60436.1 hypothetical protein RI444_18295 [Paenarthrobacter sp. AT5]